MALKEPLMVKYAIGTTPLTLKADTGESLKVVDIGVFKPASNYLTVSIEATKVGFFRVGGPLGSHLRLALGSSTHSHDWKTTGTALGDQTSFASLANAGGGEIAARMIGGLAINTVYPRVTQNGISSPGPMKTILGLLREKGIFKGYPVAEGQELALDVTTASDTIQMVTYEVYDAGDIKDTDENGGRATSYMLLNYGHTGATISTTKENLYDVSTTPTEFPNFPFAELLPPRKKISIYGVMASDVAPGTNDGTNATWTEYLRFISDRVTLFNQDGKGLLLYNKTTDARASGTQVGEGVSLCGNYSDRDYRLPFFFPQPLTFTAGDELLVYLLAGYIGTGAGIATNLQEICLIERIESI